ncbi:MAG TPA: hypothetical protein VFF73_26495 [Planctomycetota bacterium]|nr:hypothetical protein [Planctomycetota bacterium]
MSCPEIGKVALPELDPETQAHVDSCTSCREKRARLDRLLTLPAEAVPPKEVLPKLLAQIDAQIAREAARPVRVPQTRRIAAAIFAMAVVGASVFAALSRSELNEREQRLQTIVLESEWRALGYSSEQQFLADVGGGK